MKLIPLLFFIMTAQFALAQEWAAEKVNKSPRHHEWITVKYGDRSVDAFVAYPESSKKSPVMLVIHTINGMIDWIPDISDQIAEAGYIAVAPDLLSGMGPHGGRTTDFDPKQVNEAISKLPTDQIIADLNAVADYALKFPSSNGHLSVVGFCWGGNQSFLFSTKRPDLKAAYVFYGTPPSKEAMENIKAPVYAFYGGADNRVTSTKPTAEENMKADGKTFEGEVYDGAGHGFMQSGEDPNGNPANKRAREDAWDRWRRLLAKNM